MTRRIFQDIVGQDRAIDVLAGAIASERLHHAWIFHGPFGVGKFTTARAFAEALLTPGVSAQNGDVVGPERAPGAFTHPDLHIVTKELARHSEERRVRDQKLQSIPKEVIVERLLTPAALAPTINAPSIAKKVFIVDEAELLNTIAQNAVLKTLEEPPAGTVIILVTSSEDRLLATIRSRCQRVAFGLLDETSMRDWVQRAKLDAPAGELNWLVEFSRGSPGLLLQTKEAGLAAGAQTIEPLLSAAEHGRYDAHLGPALSELVESWASGWVERHKDENPSKDAANKVGAARVLDLVSERARRRLWQSDPGSAECERALRDIDLVAQAQWHINANVNLKLAMENLAAQLAR